MPNQILVVDVPCLLELLAGLDERQARLVPVSNRRQAMRCIYLDRPDLVIVDLASQKVDGEQVYHRLRELTVAIPVIVLMPQGLAERLVKKLGFGPNDYYLTKPLEPGKVEALIRVILPPKPALTGREEPQFRSA
jgi:DNA-binding response OmpR family regulator